MAKNEILRVEKACINLPEGRTLFSNLGFIVESGSITLIKGANGSGKSTLLRGLVGDNALLSAKIEGDMSQMQFLPQNDDDIAFPIHLGELASGHFGKLLPESMSTRSWLTASGGERKRALLARCLSYQPRLLILDEPFNHLDQVTIEVLCQQFREYCDQQGGILLVSHLVPEILNDRIQHEVQL